MMRRIACVVLCSVSVGLVATGCGPATVGEPTGTSSQPLGTCPDPFTVAVPNVWVDDSGHIHHGWVCASEAGPPDPLDPPMAGAWTSCPANEAVAPPLPGCTSGFILDDGANQLFLCPTTTTFPANTGHCPSQPVGYEWIVGSVHNGCFGDPVDSNYAYVLATDPCIVPNGCGAKCVMGLGGP